MTTITDGSAQFKIQTTISKEKVEELIAQTQAVTQGTATPVYDGTLTWGKYGRVVHIALTASITSLNASSTWKAYRVFTGLPKPLFYVRGIHVNIDGQATENYCSLNTDGELFYNTRNVSSNTKLITGINATYISAE